MRRNETLMRLSEVKSHDNFLPTVATLVSVSPSPLSILTFCASHHSPAVSPSGILGEITFPSWPHHAYQNLLGVFSLLVAYRHSSSLWEIHPTSRLITVSTTHENSFNVDLVIHILKDVISKTVLKSFLLFFFAIGVKSNER